MNKNGIVAVVVVITAVVLVGLWVMRADRRGPAAGSSTARRRRGRVQPRLHEERRIVSGTWTAPAGGEPPTTYVIEAGSSPGLNNQGTFVVPGDADQFRARKTPAGTYYVRVFARNACGTSPASNEVQFTVP